jgi:hypothetical protein
MSLQRQQYYDHPEFLAEQALVNLNPENQNNKSPE